MKPSIVVWMNMPSHHQSDYFFALSKITALTVNYIAEQDRRRKNLGWKLPSTRPYEHYQTSMISQLRSLIKHRQSTQVITGCGNISNILIWIFCRILNINWCHLSEDVPLNKSRSWLKRTLINAYYKSINSSAICAFAIGNKAKRSFEALGVRSDKIHITNYSSALGTANETRSETTLPFKAIVLGEIAPHKGSDIIIDIASHFIGKLEIDFYGSVDTENNNLADKISRLPNANYKGSVTSDSVPKLWANYDFLIFPSRTDGWGMAVHEAIAHNTPVICSLAAGCAEHLVKDKYNGLIVSPTPESLAEAINVYLKSPKTLDEHAQHCQHHKLKFSPESTAQRFVQCLALGK